MTRAHAVTMPFILVVALSCGVCAAHRPAVAGTSGGHAVEVAVDSPRTLAAIWDAEHVSPPLPPLVRHADVVQWIARLKEQSPHLFATEEIGRSIEGRSINHVSFGRGPFHVLLWSQMHGDEPSATSALFDVFEFVRRHRDEPVVRRMLDALTLHVVPMLNPDGAERFQRRNAQGLDVNRDALLMQSPEGRALKALRDRVNAPLGFNLHNQDWRTSVGKTREPASISLLAVAFDAALTDNPRRVRAKQVCVTIRKAVESVAGRRVARYEDEFEVRAFGDNVTKWGTSVVLIETGGWPGDRADAALVRLNFVAIVTALESLATGAVDREQAAAYTALPVNDSNLFYTMIRGASIVTGTGVAPFTGDIGLNVNRSVQTTGGTRQMHVTTRIQDLGDLRVFGALETVDAYGTTVAPLFDPALKAGDETRLPDWTTWKGNTVATGQPGNLVLLRPLDGSRFRVERVFVADTVAGTVSTATTNDR